MKNITIFKIRQIINQVLIHCTEGKDRTGFVCTLIEGFAGATYAEIVEDYMMTYFNYYAITKAFDEKKYTTIVENLLNPMIEVLMRTNVECFNNEDTFVIQAENYLKYSMTDAQIENLRNKSLI